MKIIGIIPARGGSKGIPNKNIRILGDKPLIQYTIESAQEAKYLAKVILSTDSQNIAEIAANTGIEVPFIRPNELAQDDTPTLPVIHHALQWLINKGESYDAVCLLQPTTPFRSKGFIDMAIEQFTMSGADSMISVLPIPPEYNPHWVFEPNEQGFLRISTGEKQIIPRRQELPPAFIRDGSIYLTKTRIILNKKSIFGDKIDFIETDGTYHVNIDSLNDWEKALEKYPLWLRESTK